MRPTPGRDRPPTPSAGGSRKSPIAARRKKRWAPNDVMLHFWDELAEQPEQQDMRYVLTLLLVRRRVFRLEEEKLDDAGAGSVGGRYVPAARPRMRFWP